MTEPVPPPRRRPQRGTGRGITSRAIRQGTPAAPQRQAPMPPRRRLQRAYWRGWPRSATGVQARGPAGKIPARAVVPRRVPSRAYWRGLAGTATWNQVRTWGMPSSTSVSVLTTDAAQMAAGQFFSFANPADDTAGVAPADGIIYQVTGFGAPSGAFTPVQFTPPAPAVYPGYDWGWSFTGDGSTASPQASTPTGTSGIPVSPNSPYTVGIPVLSPQGWAGGVVIVVTYYNSAGTQVSSFTSTPMVIPAGIITLVTFQTTSAATAAFAGFSCRLAGTPPASVQLLGAPPVPGTGPYLSSASGLTFTGAHGATLVTLQPWSAPASWNSNYPAGYVLQRVAATAPSPQRVTTAPVVLATAFVRSRMPRFYAQDILSGKWLHRDIPNVTQPLVTHALNGAGSATFTITPQHPSLGSSASPLLQMWETAIYIEEADEIKFGGIITDQSWLGATWNITLSEFSSYANGLIFDRNKYQVVATDAMDVIRFIWGYIQGLPNGNIHLDVDTVKSGYLLGNQVTSSQTTQINPATHQKSAVSSPKLIPYVLDYWDQVDLGAEITNISEEVPFEWYEKHTWASPAKLGVRHALRFGIPRIGIRQQNLRFHEQENVVAPAQVEQNGSIFANAVMGLGAGTGNSTIRATSAVIDGRLRRTVAYQDQTVKRVARMQTKATRQLRALDKADEIISLTIRDHPNAPFRAFGAGDDIYVQVGSGWRAGLAVWSRITQMQQDPTTNQMVLTLARSDSFTYMAQTGMAGTE